MFRLSANHSRPQTRLSHTRVVHTYREVFALPEFRALFLVRCVTMAAISIGSLALGATTYASTGSAVLTALSMFGGPLITLLGSATVLSASDAMGPRRASTIMPIAYAVAFFLQALPHLPWGWRFAILAIPFLAGSATSGSTMRLLHDIVPPDGFVLGRATLNIAVGVMQVAGYGLGGLLLVWFSSASLFRVAGIAAAAAALIIRLGVRERPGVVSSQGLVTRTREVNRALLGSRVTRPLYLAMWVPNGLIVGCEALFVPYGGQSAAGYLFAASAAGMLLGDVVVGRFVRPRHRDRMIEPLRMLLALPYLGFWFAPPLTIALVLGFVASAGYSASLPLQERLVGAINSETRGQAFGLYSTGLMVGQAIGAAIGGALASKIGATYAMGTLAVASVCIAAALIPGLRRSAPATRSTVVTR
jgi:predicted MFS family arabinose efflux permease